MPQRRWVSTGQTEKIEPRSRRMPDFDPRTGDHLWTVATTYRVDPTQWTDPAVTPMLDHESLTYVSPVFCFHCEETYTPALSLRRCPGRPKN